jgi:hypothetical protein
MSEKLHPIVKTLAKLVTAGADGHATLTESGAKRLGEALLAFDDGSLAGAVIALACAAELSTKELGAPEIGARLFEIIDLAADRLRVIAKSRDPEGPTRRARLRALTGAQSDTHRAPLQGARPEEGSVRLASLLPRRSIR